MQKKRLTKKIKHIYFLAQNNGNNLLLNIRFKYLQKIPIKYVVIKKNNFKFSSLFAKQTFQQKALRAYYGYVGKRFLRMLYIKAKKYNIKNTCTLKQWLTFKLDAFLVKIWFFQYIYQARQQIIHGHIFIDGIIIKNNSYIVKLGNIIEINKNVQSTKQHQLFDLLTKFKAFDLILGYRWLYYIVLVLYKINKITYIEFTNSNLEWNTH